MLHQNDAAGILTALRYSRDPPCPQVLKDRVLLLKQWMEGRLNEVWFPDQVAMIKLHFKWETVENVSLFLNDVRDCWNGRVDGKVPPFVPNVAFP